MNQKDFFLQPNITAQRHYEALRAFYFEEASAQEVAERFDMSLFYFKKLRSEFTKTLRLDINPFFSTKKAGPKMRHTKPGTVDRIIALRKQNYSIADIKASMHSDNVDLSLDTIDKILKEEGFAPLP